MNPKAMLVWTAVVATCVLGLLLSVTMLRGNNPLSPEATERDHFVIGDSVSTSFGFVAVEHAEAISGLSDTDIQAGHGVSGLVQAGTISVQVSATLTNHMRDVLAYWPEQFELLDGRGTPIPLAKAPKLPEELQPQAAIDVTLGFVTTTEARPFTIRYVDPSTKQPVLIDLGAVGCTVQSGSGKPLPVAGGCTQAPADHPHDSEEHSP